MIKANKVDGSIEVTLTREEWAILMVALRDFTQVQGHKVEWFNETMLANELIQTLTDTDLVN